MIARGGRGGHGNRRFANSTRQTPRFAERGTAGEEGWVELRLKLHADAGLIGMPNAGKSSLLARLTRAAPKVADYPFTTLEPVLGTIEDDDRQAVLADIPGLIEGAAGGAGLGHEFLAHVERCRMLIHLVELAPLEGDPVANYEAVRAELGSYGAGLGELPELVVLSKRDLLSPEEVEEAVAGWEGRLTGAGRGVLAVSSATGEGLDVLRREILDALPEPAPAARPEPRRRSAEFEVELPDVPARGRGRLPGRARGRRRLPRARPRCRDALRAPRPRQRGGARLPRAAAQRDGRGGRAALGRIRAGDEVRIGGHEFELHPG